MPQPDRIAATSGTQAPILPLFVIVLASRVAPFSSFVYRRYVQPTLTRNCPVPLESVHFQVVVFEPKIAGQLRDALWRCAGSGGVCLRRLLAWGWGSSQEHTSARLILSRYRQALLAVSTAIPYERSAQPAPLAMQAPDGKGAAMPVYEYRCRECEECFKVIAHLAERDKLVICPKCHGKNVEFVISSFACVAPSEY